MDSDIMISAYSKLAQRIWEDEDYKQRALDDPRAALAENGWELPGGTEVSLKMVQIAELPPAEDSNADRVIAEWRKGIEADRFPSSCRANRAPGAAVDLRRGAIRRRRRLLRLHRVPLLYRQLARPALTTSTSL